MFWKNFKLTPTLFFLLVIGISNSFLFLTKNPIILKTNHIPISPLPLVFDSPKGVDYWTYTYDFTFETNQGTVNLLGDKKIFTDFRRGWFNHIFVHYIFSSILISDSSKHNLKILENFACTGLIKTFKNEPNLKVYKVNIKFLDLNLTKQKERTFLCI